MNCLFLFIHVFKLFFLLVMGKPLRINKVGIGFDILDVTTVTIFLIG